MGLAIDLLYKCLASAGENLRNVLNVYWPVKTEGDIPEGMQTFYIANALFQSKFLIIPLSQNANKQIEHVDMIGISHEQKIIVILEAKRLYSTEKGKELGDDWDRLCGRFRLPKPRQNDSPFDSSYQCFACLTASTWKQNYMDWWNSAPRPICPNGVRCDEQWKHLHNALSRSSIVTVSPLHTREDWDQPAWFLGAIVPVESSLWM